MRTVFFKDKQIHLVTEKPTQIDSKRSIIFNINKETNLKSLVQKQLFESHYTNIFFVNIDNLWLFEHFCSIFKIVSAAGGVVKNTTGSYLFIFRNNKWDLPKGKIEANETTEIAAVREVEEECGISQLYIEHQLPTTYHIYELKNELILKPTYWFSMNCSDNSNLIPQTEEGITAVEWITPEAINKVLANTFPALENMIKQL